MRETRLSGSEGGAGYIPVPTPINSTSKGRTVALLERRRVPTTMHGHLYALPQASRSCFGGLSVGFHANARTHEITISVNVIHATHGGPELRLARPLVRSEEHTSELQ